MLYWVRVCVYFVICSVNVMLYVVDTGCIVIIVVFFFFISIWCIEILVW